MWRNPEFILLSDRHQSEKATYCINPTIWHTWNLPWKGQNYRYRNIIRGFQRLRGREGWIERVQRSFRAEKVFCMTLQWWMLIIRHLSKPVDCTTPGVKPNLNYGLQVVMMCDCRCISCYNIPPWHMILKVREFLCALIQGLYGNSLYFMFNFSVNLKLVKKKSLFNRKNWNVVFRILAPGSQQYIEQWIWNWKI